MSAPNELSFLPEDYLEQKQMRRAVFVCATLAVLTVGTIACWWQITSRRHAKILADFNDVNNSYVDAARKIEQVKRMHEQQREVVHHAELAASLVERVPRSNMLAEITNALPPDVYLLELSMTSTPHQEAAAPKTSFAAHQAQLAAKNNSDALGLGTKPPRFDIHLKLTGIARDDGQVAQLISRLSHDKLFEDVNLIVSDTYTEPTTDKAAPPDPLRKWQLEMAVNPMAEVREAAQTAAVDVNN